MPGEAGEGSQTEFHERKKKIEDDQTPYIPAIFAEWKAKEGIAW